MLSIDFCFCQLMSRALDPYDQNVTIHFEMHIYPFKDKHLGHMWKRSLVF